MSLRSQARRGVARRASPLVLMTLILALIVSSITSGLTSGLTSAALSSVGLTLGAPEVQAEPAPAPAPEPGPKPGPKPAPAPQVAGASQAPLATPPSASVQAPRAPGAARLDPYALPMKDRGLLSGYDGQVRLRSPSWLAQADRQHVALGPHVYEVVDGSPVALSALSPQDAGVIQAPRCQRCDQDGDELPDGLDIVAGAHKLALNRATYKATYQALAYPMGDVPLEIGVCTDVVVRALRNAGMDLQALLHQDITRHPARYPMVKKTNTHIDHRRVKTLLPYFMAHWESLPPQPSDTSRAWLPGDVLFMNTWGDARPDHMGVVSDQVGPSGYPLVINNWTDGWRTSAMDLLGFVQVTHRFRAPTASLKAPPEHLGLQGLLMRRGVSIPQAHGQLVVVTAPAWDSAWGQLRRFERQPGRGFVQVGSPQRVALGGAGLGQGRGALAARLHDGPLKIEGDGRSPAGVFRLGLAFGPQAKPPYAGGWPWRQVTARDRFVDDPASAAYNTWATQPAQGAPPWRSAEALSMYSLGLIVEHNMSPILPGAGSAIFIHSPVGPELGESRPVSKRKPAPLAPTQGCTAMPEDELRRLLGWLKPAQQPLLVQLVGQWW